MAGGWVQQSTPALPISERLSGKIQSEDEMLVVRADNCGPEPGRCESPLRVCEKVGSKRKAGEFTILL